MLPPRALVVYSFGLTAALLVASCAGSDISEVRAEVAVKRIDSGRTISANRLAYIGEMHNQFLKPTFAELLKTAKQDTASVCEIVRASHERSVASIARRFGAEESTTRRILGIALARHRSGRVGSASLRAVSEREVPCLQNDHTEQINLYGSALRDDPILPCYEACDEGPSYDPTTGPSAQALALVAQANTALALATSPADLATRLSSVISSGGGLETHNSDLVLGYASIMQSSFENASSALEATSGCTEAQKREKGREVGYADAAGFFSTVGAALGAGAAAGGPPVWTGTLAAGVGGALGASAVWLIKMVNEC